MAKKMSIPELRALIADQAIGVDEIATRFDVGRDTVQVWSRGLVPKGAPPFPPEVKANGRARLWCTDEVAAWIGQYARTKG
jgi:hypothetical protein